MLNQGLGLFHRKTSALRHTAFLCLALQIFSIASAVASPLLNGAVPGIDHKKQSDATAPMQEYVLLIPAERETNATIAARFGVSESALAALQNQASRAGWTGRAILIPRQTTGESRLYPAYPTHALAKGETLGSLAIKVNRSEPELRRLNTLVLGDAVLSNLIRVWPPWMTAGESLNSC